DRLPLSKQLLYQAIALLIAFSVLFPIMWVVSLSLDPRDISRPPDFRLIPPGASLKAYSEVLKQPTANPVTFAELAFNSLKLAAGVAVFSVFIGVFAAYSFSRFEFRGRRGLMLGVVTVLMLPSVATVAPLFVMLNRINVDFASIEFNLRNSLWGVGLALTSTALPFAIWNLKGYLDTIPKELEEAARIDGASLNQVFFLIVLPLAVPALAVTGFLGFLSGWTEFVMSWQFLSNPKDFTLAMSLWNMTGQFSGDTPWSKFSAMALMVALPVAVVYLVLQRYIVGGLTVGSVK
ncbi:MAG TPA: ABC transporter permease subunit, partial [Anaerolineales bacterium]|nr:ABC transporter permease subunit [Anaerolineales bacterium]